MLIYSRFLPETDPYQCPFLPRLYHTESTVCTGSDHDSFISAFTSLQCPAMQSNIYILLYRIPCLCTELSILYLHIFILFCRTFQQEGIACLEDRTGTGIPQLADIAVFEPAVCIARFPSTMRLPLFLAIAFFMALFISVFSSCEKRSDVSLTIGRLVFDSNCRSSCY